MKLLTERSIVNLSFQKNVKKNDFWFWDSAVKYFCKERDFLCMGDLSLCFCI